MTDSSSFFAFYNVVDGALRRSPTIHNGIDPANCEKLWDTPVASKVDVNDAVEAAKKAFKEWKKTTFDQRVQLLREWQDALKIYSEEFSLIIMRENGKPVSAAIPMLFGHCLNSEKKKFADVEVQHSFVNMFEYFLSLKIPEEHHAASDREYRVKYTPLGVVVGITAWNFPLGQPLMKALPALLVGNCFILKPSPFTPYSGLKAVEIAQRFLPPGVLQVLGGDDQLGPWLTHHPDVHKVSFTGSTASGKKVAAAATQTLKRVTLELGGNDAAIVFPDVDVDEIAPQIAMGCFWNSGQVCTAMKRLYIHEDVYAKMLDALVREVKKMKMAPGTEAGAMVGPVQNEAQYQKLKDLFQDALEHNGKVVFGGSVREGAGYFFEPTIVDKLSDDSRLVTEEQFGPIVPVLPWSNEEDVVKRANNTAMGLAASVWTKNLTKAEEIADQLEVGSVYINSSEKVSFEVPFGGHKQSGIGYECGPNALAIYCDMQILHYNFKS
ncbi:uncharacterized protein A1O5_09405 [Cladophialophora psammophila CBS 110553]|uniref:aldehyde dehydrogenase (NAD(+)) n=1 Tax=Cladophialophora psammophila CBS 110553 TaxID=1182543 RepID=W9WH01_9EURO|nr:uncharacterized protein A1O5_09405 [Cladophialophora psammophila CBS 110553]EXJ67392.1 hypothetical protein A1O5_09405 [Cladophialophora psammophila CBS 110553]